MLQPGFPRGLDEAVDDAAVLVDRERPVLLAAGYPPREPDDAPDPGGADRQDHVELRVHVLALDDRRLVVGARLDPPALGLFDPQPLVESKPPLLRGQAG